MASARAAWVAALRHGGYVQGKYALQRNRDYGTPSGVAKTYCCLGVACEVAMAAGVDLQYVGPSEGDRDRKDGVGVYSWGDGTSKEINGETLPEVVMQWLGMKTNDGRFEMPHDEWVKYLDGVMVGSVSLNAVRTLVSLNDAGVSFDLIADLIESMPDDLFEEE